MLLMMMVTFITCFALADTEVVSPADFLSEIINFVRSAGGLSTFAIISGVITLLLASMKVSFLNDLVWSKLGEKKIWAAPIIGLIAGILGLGHDGKITGAMIFAYITTGFGAIALHEILDLVKLIPGIGSIYVTIINIIEGALGGPSADAK